MKTALLAAFIAAWASFWSASHSAAADEPTWFEAGKARLAETTARKDGRKRAKNVILFVGDGMGVATVTAARILDGQLRGVSGEKNALSFETLPYTGFSKTYTADNQIGESAGTGTALMTGWKTASGVIGVGEAASPRETEAGFWFPPDCGASMKLATAVELAEEKGLATGVVTTTRFTHATPAAAYAHVPMRDFESDRNVARIPEAVQAGCVDIARQFVEFSAGDGIDVALGGGIAAFTPAGRADSRDLIDEWKMRRGGAFVSNAGELAASREAKGPIFGLFSESHMDYEADRKSGPDGQPSLSEMTGFAIDRLSRAKKGYFLLVEGGRIDHAHHAGNAFRALTDTIEFAKAVSVALEKTGDETLIIVTADHSHTLFIAGYAPRGNPILGLAGSRGSADGAFEPYIAEDGKPYTVLGYGNGPGGSKEPRADLKGVDTEHSDYAQQALVPLYSETHGGEDVPIYAKGPLAHALTGVLEQNVIFHVMAAALRL